MVLEVKIQMISKNLTIALIIGLAISIIINGFFIMRGYNNINILSEKIIQEGNITYKQYLKNYYDVEYRNEGRGLILRINNPCIVIWESTGESMKPYIDKESLAIIDTCYPPENLMIGDIIVYDAEYSTKNIHHRIIDIDYDKEWIRTQGDNNKYKDDFVSFDLILGKDIGILNVVEDKKIIKEEVVDETNGTFFINLTIRGVQNGKDKI